MLVLLLYGSEGPCISVPQCSGTVGQVRSFVVDANGKPAKSPPQKIKQVAVTAVFSNRAVIVTVFICIVIGFSTQLVVSVDLSSF